MMKETVSNARGPELGHGATDLDLLRHPLEFVTEDHMHVRTMCETLEHVASEAAPELRSLMELESFLTYELPPLLQDEDDDLAALLRQRCEPEDDLEPVLARLAGDHERIAQAMPAVTAILQALHSAHRPATETERGAILAFANDLKGHIIVENAIILPLARARLTEDDEAVLRGRMIARRTSRMQV